MIDDQLNGYHFTMKIFIFVMDLIGPQNASIGLAQALQERGHEIHFLVSERTGDRFTHYGFNYHSLEDVASVDVKDGENNKLISEQMKRLNIFSNLSSYEKIKLFANFDFVEKLYASCLKFNSQCEQLIEKLKPDLIMINSKIVPPIFLSSGIPFVSIFCANPLALYDSICLPPYTSGLPTKVDLPAWERHTKALHDSYYVFIQKYQRLLFEAFNLPPCTVKMTAKAISPFLNIYQYPEELDYHDLIKIPDNCVRVDAFCRKESEVFQLPEQFKDKIKGEKLIYLSMGTMGSFSVELMKKLVSILATTKHFYIISKGQMGDEYELADNMIGGNYLPQTKILPLVDMVITHGGNNSLTESIYFGKPIIVMPMFYDQFDNAQRVHEKQFGIRINPFDFEPKDLLDAIETILNDQTMHERLHKASIRIQQSQSKTMACERLEELVRCSKQT